MNGIAQHMRIAMDVLNSEIGLAKDYRTLMKKDKYLSTSRPFLLFATMSKRNAFSSGLREKKWRQDFQLWTERELVTYVWEGSPAIRALMNRWSFSGIGILLSRTR